MSRLTSVTFWLSERRRAGASALVAAIVAVVFALILTRKVLSISALDASVLVLLGYLVSYLLITMIAFMEATPAQIKTWAERDSRGTIWQRYVLGTAPGPGVSIFFAITALAVAMVWLPGRGGTTMPTGARVTVAAALAISAWVCVMVSFAVAFHADNLLEREKALDFPGDPSPQWSDYIYFALSVMTTFGATDVSVTSKQMRRTVTVNALIAFVFNTVTVAAVVSALTG